MRKRTSKVHPGGLMTFPFNLINEPSLQLKSDPCNLLIPKWLLNVFPTRIQLGSDRPQLGSYNYVDGRVL